MKKKTKDSILKSLDEIIHQLKSREELLASCPEGLELDELEKTKDEAICEVLNDTFDVLDKFVDTGTHDKSAWADVMIKANKYKDKLERLKRKKD